jgi:amino acid transporter
LKGEKVMESRTSNDHKTNPIVTTIMSALTFIAMVLIVVRSPYSAGISPHTQDILTAIIVGICMLLSLMCSFRAGAKRGTFAPYGAGMSFAFALINVVFLV